jgi:hypothetical protein
VHAWLHNNLPHKCSWSASFQGTVSQDFLFQVFIAGDFKFFKKFLEIFTSQGAPLISTTGINDTGGKFAIGTAVVVNTGGKSTVHQQQITGTTSDCMLTP